MKNLKERLESILLQQYYKQQRDYLKANNANDAVMEWSRMRVTASIYQKFSGKIAPAPVVIRFVEYAD